MKTNKPDRDTLYRLYVEELMTTQQIADVCGCCSSSICNWLIASDIKPRDMSAAQLKNKSRPTDNELFIMYVDDIISLTDIATKYDVSINTVGRWLDVANIEHRNPFEVGLKGKIVPTCEALYGMYIVEKITVYDISVKHAVSKDIIYGLLKRCGIDRRSSSEALLRGSVKPTKEELNQMYTIDKLTVETIADKIGVGHSSISNWLNEYGIYVRSTGESIIIGNYRGERSKRWTGGNRRYCHKFNDVFRESVREEFGRGCFICGKTEEENGRKLDVHHVNYSRMCMCNDIDCRFVPLCVSCHAKTNYNRAYWYSYIMCKLLLESSAQFVNIDLCI